MCITPNEKLNIQYFLHITIILYDVKIKLLFPFDEILMMTGLMDQFLFLVFHTYLKSNYPYIAAHS